MTHNEMAKGGGIKQTRPQETDSTYSKAIDKQVSGKPVGYRFTDKLAKKLGKKPGTKPTAAEIEKYKNRGVYFETRKNKSDINPKAKLEGGGDMEYAKGGTIASIVKKFKPKAIKHEGNSKDGYSVLIKDKNSDFQAWIDVYIDERHKDVITEWNKYIFHLDDENDVRDKAVMENDDVFQDSMSESINYLSDKGFIRNDDKANWHYTKRDGGDVEYAKGGKTKSHFIDLDAAGLNDSSFKRWLKNNNISFSILEEQGDAGYNPFVRFAGSREDLKSLIDNYYNNDKETINDYYEQIEKYAKGGQTSPQRESYTKRGDKEVKAKPVGYRFTEKLANRLGKNVFTKPTQEQIEKYRGKGVYFENRKDKSDINPRAMFMHGGHNDEVLGNGRKLDRFTAVGIAEGFVEKQDWNDELKAWAYIQRHGLTRSLQGWFGRTAEEMIDRGLFDRKGNIDWEVANEIWDEDDEYAKGGQTKSHYVELDVFNFDSSMKRWLNNNDISYKIIDEEGPAGGAPLVKFFGKKEDLKSLIDKYYGENNDVEEWYEEIKSYAKGGQTSPQRESYSKRGDKEVKAKPVGYRFTEKLANRLGKNVYTKPTQEQIAKYSGKKNGIYFENRKDKSDVNPRAMFEEGGDMEYAKGGLTKSHYVELDVFNFDSSMKRWLNNNDISYKIIDEEGPAGGAPLVKFFGKKEDLKSLIDKYYGENNDVEEWYEEIKSYAKGGQTSPQRESYSRRGDKEVSAKPVGYRFTNALAKRLGKKVTTRPSMEEVRKYLGKGIYFENRKDKSDVNPKAKLMGGGDTHYAKGGKIANQYTSIKRNRVWGRVDGVWNAWTKKQREHFLNDHIDELVKDFYASDLDGNKVVSMNWDKLLYNDEDLAIRIADSIRDHIEMGQYAKGGGVDKKWNGRIVDQYANIPKDKIWGKAKNLWNAWTKEQRKNWLYHNTTFGESSGWNLENINEDTIHRYDWDYLQSKNVDFVNQLAEHINYIIKDGQYAKGGQTAPQETDSTYSKSIDKRVSGKPVGYRFTNKLANKLGKKPFTRPTAAEIEKYSGKGVYFETRKNKSDLNPKAKLEGGGESEYARGGGVPRTSNADSKAYTENHLPFMANNLEGKTLENGDYVVLSYGYYPIWFWHKRTNKWYGNKDKFSVTTAKHISQSRPTYDAQMLSRGEMDNLMSKSIEGKDFKEMGGTLESFEVAQP